MAECLLGVHAQASLCNERHGRQEANLEDIRREEESARLYDEAMQATNMERWEERKEQQEVEVRANLALRADARDEATDRCQARKDMIYSVAQREKVEEIEAKDVLREESVNQRRLALEDRADEKERLADERQILAKWNRESEIEDARVQAIEEIEEARAVLEDYGINVNMIGLQVGTATHSLAMENSLEVHENRMKRLGDRESRSPRVADAEPCRLVDDGDSACSEPLSTGGLQN